MRTNLAFWRGFSFLKSAAQNQETGLEPDKQNAQSGRQGELYSKKGL